jgi:membrane fusion protein, multidrug efflux system
MTPEPLQPMDEDNSASTDGPSRKWLLGLGIAGVAALGWWGLSAGGDGDVWPADPEKAAVAAGPDAVTQSAAPRPAAAPALATVVRGLIKPQREATIASKMTAVITQMPLREGQSFGAGALLARFDCSQTQAELNAARAAAAAYRSTYEQNAELEQYEAIGRNEVEISRANLGRADAEAQAIAARMTDCAVYAPFAGTVVERIANVREVAASGQPLMRIQTGRDVELELIVPSRWLTWLGPGATFGFRIDETGNDIRGVVTRLGASVDPVSRTIRVTARVTNTNGLVLPGMSGTATFDDPRASGAAGTAVPARASTPSAATATAAAPAARP